MKNYYNKCDINIDDFFSEKFHHNFNPKEYRIKMDVLTDFLKRNYSTCSVHEIEESRRIINGEKFTRITGAITYFGPVIEINRNYLELRDCKGNPVDYNDNLTIKTYSEKLLDNFVDSLEKLFE